MKKNKARNKRAKAGVLVGIIRMSKQTKRRANHVIELHPALQHWEDLCKCLVVN